MEIFIKFISFCGITILLFVIAGFLTGFLCKHYPKIIKKILGI